MLARTSEYLITIFERPRLSRTSIVDTQAPPGTSATLRLTPSPSMTLTLLPLGVCLARSARPEGGVMSEDIPFPSPIPSLTLRTYYSAYKPTILPSKSRFDLRSHDSTFEVTIRPLNHVLSFIALVPLSEGLRWPRDYFIFFSSSFLTTGSHLPSPCALSISYSPWLLYFTSFHMIL
jgi:hypothetical protein